MANWNKVEKATQSAMNSQDSYMKEQEAYFNSISGHLARLESAWQSLATNSLDSDFTKSLIDAVTWIVKLTDACGGLQVVLVGLIASFVSFKAILSIDFLKNLVTQFTLLAKTATVAGASVTTLSLAGKLLIGGGVVAGIMAIGYGINYLTTQSERAEKQVKTLSDNLKELSKTNDNTKSLANNFEKLSSVLDKTPEQTQELIDTQNQLKELLPNLKGYYDELGNFNIETDKEKANLSELVDLQQQSLDLERERLNLASKKVVDYSINDYEKESKRLKRLIELQKLNKKWSNEGLSRQEQQRRINLNNILGVSAGGSLSKEIENVRNDIDKSLTDISDKFINSISTTKEWGKLTKDQANAIRKSFSELDEKTLINYVNSIENGSLTTEDFIKIILKSPSAIKYLKDALNNVKDTTDDTTQSIKTLEESIASLSNTRSNIESLTSILNNLSAGNKLTASDMEHLLSISEEFLPYLNNEIALREKLTQSISEYKDTYQQGYYEILNISEEFYNAKVKGDETLYDTLRGNVASFFNDLGIKYTDDFKNYKNLEEAKAKLTDELVKKLSGQWYKYFDAFTGEIDPRVGWGGGALGANGELTDDVVEVYNQIKSAKDELYKIFNDSIYEPIEIKFDSDSTANSAKEVLSEIDRLKQELEKRLQDNEFEISVLEFSGGEVQKQISIYQQMQDEIHKLAQKYRAMGLSENDDYIQNLRTQWMKYAENISQLQSVAFDNSNKSIDRTITQLDLQQQLFKDNSQEYLDIEQKKYDEIVKRENLLQQEIARLQAIGTNSAKEQAESLIDTYYDTVSQRYNIIKNLQSSQISIYNEQIKDLERQKSAMEDLHKFTMQMIKDELNAKKKSIQEEIKGIEEVFNKRKQALRDEKDARSYEKGLTEKSSLVADLENQLAIIKNDETAIAKRKKLEEELAKAKEDLADYQYEHSIDLQEKALDSELEKVKQTYEDRIDELDETLSNEVRLREFADKKIKQSGEKLYKELINYSKEYGSITEDEIKNAWDNANISLKGYKSTQEDVLDKLKEVTAELSKIENLNLKDYSNKSGLSTKNAEQTKAEMKVNSAKWLEASKNNDTKKMEDMARANQELGNAMGWYYDPATGIWWEDKNKKVRIYHSGGIVGGNNYATKSTEELAKLLKGELVITPPQADKLMSMITNNNNNTESFAPEINIIIEGNAEESIIELLKKESKNIANMVASEFNKTRANTGWKKPVKSY